MSKTISQVTVFRSLSLSVIGICLEFEIWILVLIGNGACDKIKLRPSPGREAFHGVPYIFTGTPGDIKARLEGCATQRERFASKFIAPHFQHGVHPHTLGKTSKMIRDIVENVPTVLFVSNGRLGSLRYDAAG